MLYLTEPIDEVTIQNLAKFGEHAFVDVSKEEIDLGEDEDEKAKVRARAVDVPHRRWICKCRVCTIKGFAWHRPCNT